MRRPNARGKIHLKPVDSRGRAKAVRQREVAVAEVAELRPRSFLVHTLPLRPMPGQTTNGHSG